MKRLYATTDPVEAQILRALLRNAGIESALENEGGADFAIGMSTSAVPLGISVDDHDAEAALKILEAHFEKQPLPSDDDPEAPEPLSAEESELLEASVRRISSRWRHRLLVVYFVPPAIVVGVTLCMGEFGQALLTGAAVLAMFAAVWFINLLVESQVKEKGPAS